MDQTQFNNGACLDTRPEEKKLKDFDIKETVATIAVVDWREKPESMWRKFPDQNQASSGSCVMQSIQKIGAILLWLKEGVYIPLSGTPIYQKRSNRPANGMIGVEAFDLWQKDGMTLEALVPSQNMSDDELDNAKIYDFEREVGKVFKIGGHIGITENKFETIASVIQKTGKPVMVWFFFNSEEWSRKIPIVIDHKMTPENAWGRHSTVDVDFTLVGGKKYLVIEDSAHFGGLTRRLISEEFFNERNFFARYPMNFVFDTETIPKPNFMFARDLTLGMMNSVEVKMLQDCLKYEGLLATNIDSTGNFLAMTKASVQKFQLKYGIALATDPGYGRVGPLTRAKLNELFA